MSSSGTGGCLGSTLTFHIFSLFLDADGSHVITKHGFRANVTRVSSFLLGLVLIPGVIMNFRNGFPGVGAAALVLSGICFHASWMLRRDRSYLKNVQFIMVPSLFVGLWFAFDTHGVLAAFWIYPAITFFYLLLGLRQAAIANALLLLMVGAIFFGAVDFPVFVRMIAAMALMNFFVATFVATIEQQQEQLKGAAISDALTGLLNRMTLSHTLDDAIRQNLRSRIPMTILAIDLDHFKKINDEHGHDGGDQVLRNFAALLKSRFRRTDKIFRNGGEEFMILLFDTGRSGAISIAESLLRDLRAFEGLMTSASIGVAEYQQNEHHDDWIKRADERLYEAKRAGRDRVVS